jgi:YlmC/YmxH family sporulation protein
VNVDNGHLVAIVVPGPCKYFGLFGRGDDIVIPWGCIRRIGDDLILVERR